MEKCFVIQPFDGGIFDQRFVDVFKPAIEKADFEAYRVDRDLSVRIPIEEIQNGIVGSAICFAEITTDNPNVWYELGYAFACGKDVIMVCSDEREKKYPFDIQHKKIIEYATKSKSDYEKLEKEITNVIRAYQKTANVTQSLSKLPIKKTEGLESHEIAILIFLMENSLTINHYTSFYSLRQEMGKSGYTDIATSVAIRTLAKNNMLEISSVSDNYEPYEVCTITEKGENWILSNQDKLQFRKCVDTIVENKNDLPF